MRPQNGPHSLAAHRARKAPTRPSPALSPQLRRSLAVIIEAHRMLLASDGIQMFSRDGLKAFGNKQ